MFTLGANCQPYTPGPDNRTFVFELEAWVIANLKNLFFRGIQKYWVRLPTSHNPAVQRALFEIKRLFFLEVDGLKITGVVKDEHLILQYTK